MNGKRAVVLGRSDIVVCNINTGQVTQNLKIVIIRVLLSLHCLLVKMQLSLFVTPRPRTLKALYVCFFHVVNVL